MFPKPYYGIIPTHLLVIVMGHGVQCNATVWLGVRGYTLLGSQRLQGRKGVGPFMQDHWKHVQTDDKTSNIQKRSLPTHKEPGTSCASLKSL